MRSAKGALGHSCFTRGHDWGDLKDMVTEAIWCYFGKQERPRVIRRYFVREEVIAVCSCREIFLGPSFLSLVHGPPRGAHCGAGFPTKVISPGRSPR